jgi:Holliday junction resolvase RusA-like endonuclease
LKYQEAAGWYIPLKHGKINKKLNIKCLFYMSIDYDNTKAIIDLNGLHQAIDDILVHYGVIEDDNCRIVAGHDGSRVLYDKKNPRTEIEITEVTGCST